MYTADGKRVSDNTADDEGMFFKFDRWIIMAAGVGIASQTAMRQWHLNDLSTYQHVKRLHTLSRGKHTRTCWLVDPERQPISGGHLQVKVTESTTLQMLPQSKVFYIKFVDRAFEWVLNGVKADLRNSLAFDSGEVPEVAEAEAANDGNSEDFEGTEHASGATTSPLFSADEVSALRTERIRYWESKQALKATYNATDGSGTKSVMYLIRIKGNKKRKTDVTAAERSTSLLAARNRALEKARMYAATGVDAPDEDDDDEHDE